MTWKVLLAISSPSVHSGNRSITSSRTLLRISVANHVALRVLAAIGLSMGCRGSHSREVEDAHQTGFQLVVGFCSRNMRPSSHCLRQTFFNSLRASSAVRSSS